jgi:ribosomal protein S18 acetylase RimI-like enzyme
MRRWLGFFQKGHSVPGYAVRQAAHDDTEALAEMLVEADRVAWHSEVRNAARLVEEQHVFLVEDDQQLAGACGVAIGPSSIARIQVCASRERSRSREVMRAALEAVRPVLSEQGVETLAFIGPEEWMLAGLGAQGFERANTILALHKHTLRVPDHGNPDVTVRPVRPDDLLKLVAIDAAAFAPLWRNTKEAFEEYRTQCNEFCVAELEGTVAGYYCLSVVGHHGHITRIAVQPRYQGRRIGVRLLSEAIAALAEDGVFGITLNTQQDNERALRLYKWFGFRTLGQEAEVWVLQLLPHTSNAGIMKL